MRKKSSQFLQYLLALVFLSVFSFFVLHRIQFDSNGTTSTKNYGQSLDQVGCVEGNGKEAFATIVTSKQMLPGALTLAFSLQKFSPLRDRIAIVPQNHSRTGTLEEKHLKMLKRAGFKLAFVEKLPVPQNLTGIRTTAIQISTLWSNVLLRLSAFAMTQYDRISVIDPDVFVHGKLDQPFKTLCKSDYQLAAVLAPVLRPKYPMNHILAGHFSGSVIFAKPNMTLYRTLLEKSKQASMYPAVYYADQSLLNNYFMGNYAVLPVKYNFAHSTTYQKYYKRFYNESIVTHFTGTLSYKPWFKCKGIVCEPESVWGNRGPEWRSTFKDAVAAYGITNEELL